MPYSPNGDIESLIEQITDAIVARLNGDGLDQAGMCGCTSECFNRCPERMHRVVDAGAARTEKKQRVHRMVLPGQRLAGLGIAPVGGLEQPGDLHVIEARK